MVTNKSLEFNLPSVDDLFEPVKGKDILDIEKVIPISIKEITNFPNHPFKVVEDERMQDMVKSIKERGVMLPVIVRTKEDGGYEMISGHRRKRACELAGIEEIPCIIKNLTDEEATILMVDTNIQQREEILPSEKAFAYKMKLEAMNHQGERTDLTSRQVVEKSVSVDVIGEQNNESGRQVQRYIRLTELIPEILNMVDEKKIAFSPAVEISYLTKDEQYVLLDCMECYAATPSQAQAIHLKKLSQEGNLTAEKIEDIMGEEKPNQKEFIKIHNERIEKYIQTKIKESGKVEDFIIQCVEEHNKREKLRQERNAR
ncbi:MAG: ParB/RepB/Spo0J family partition protein [Clostridia bacterium]|nr:ParB/RepB/Spo0J family partition protein [Clostridia bacterium]